MVFSPKREKYEQNPKIKQQMGESFLIGRVLNPFFMVKALNPPHLMMKSTEPPLTKQQRFQGVGCWVLRGMSSF